ncbi:MAG: aminopeptidase [Verrucomicrobiota bacterium]
MDPRYIELASVLTAFSTKLQPGEHVLIDSANAPTEFVLALCRAVRAQKAEPHVVQRDARVLRELVANGTEAQFTAFADSEMHRMKQMQAYIAVRGSDNIFESSDVPDERMKAYMKAMRPVLNHRVNETKWVVLRWPTPSMAQQALMSTEAFEDFFFRVCTLDYARMEPGMAALKQLMESTDRVELIGPNCDLRFSIRDIPAISCGGEYNIPDGEVFTAPIKDSVEGEITFNAPTVYQGTSFDQVFLKFEKGKIIDAKCNGDQSKLESILDSDAGSRYIGEFAIGFNPHVLQPMRDILFDEKIAGSFHFTPGQAYEDADNGNRSQVHWDLVNIQREDWGGGEIRFDGNVIRKNGIFLLEELEKLNPEYLLGKD